MDPTPAPQPRDDRRADRDDRAPTEADHDASQLVPVQGSVHYEVLKHIAECLDCRRVQFTLFYESLESSCVITPRW
jgi:hypothetical protein